MTARCALRCICALAMLGAAGCAGGLLESKAPPVQRYVLQPVAARAPAAVPLPLDLTIAVGSVSPGLMTERVALVRGGRRLDYFSATAWPDMLGAFVEDLVLKSLQNDGRIATVTRPVPLAKARYLIALSVLDFQAEYPVEGQVPRAHVRFSVELVDVSARRLLDAFAVEARAESANDTMSALMNAFEQAFQSVTQDLADRVVRQLAEP